MENTIKDFYHGLQKIRIQPMKFSMISIFKVIMVVAVLLSSLLPIQTLAADYSWLKTKKHEKLFVYTDFNECNDIADRLNEAVKRILSHSHIEPIISNSLVFQMTDIDGTSVNELLDDELINNNKIILHIYGKSIKYNSAYLYQFDIHFGIIDKKISQALLYSSPQYSVMGADNKIGMDMVFRKLFEDAVTDYLSANKTK